MIGLLTCQQHVFALSFGKSPSIRGRAASNRPCSCPMVYGVGTELAEGGLRSGMKARSEAPLPSGRPEKRVTKRATDCPERNSQVGDLCGSSAETTKVSRL